MRKSNSQLITGNLQKNKGFTLIELLVVISIIGMLSSVVLSQVSQARNKAIAVKQNELARSYTLAIQQANLDSDFVYPQTASNAICVDNNVPHICKAYGSSYSTNNELISALSPYLPAEFPQPETLYIHRDGETYIVDGILYATNTSCQQFLPECPGKYLWWHVPSIGQCGSGSVELYDYGEVKSCVLKIFE